MTTPYCHKLGVKIVKACVNGRIYGITLSLGNCPISVGIGFTILFLQYLFAVTYDVFHLLTYKFVILMVIFFMIVQYN